MVIPHAFARFRLAHILILAEKSIRALISARISQPVAPKSGAKTSDVRPDVLAGKDVRTTHRCRKGSDESYARLALAAIVAG